MQQHGERAPACEVPSLGRRESGADVDQESGTARADPFAVVTAGMELLERGPARQADVRGLSMAHAGRVGPSRGQGPRNPQRLPAPCVSASDRTPALLVSVPSLVGGAGAMKDEGPGPHSVRGRLLGAPGRIRTAKRSLSFIERHMTALVERLVPRRVVGAVQVCGVADWGDMPQSGR